MKAIPTLYNGIQYRSLLEARWAAWFRAAGVRVAYEPEALSGYIPDFMYRDHVHLRGDVYATATDAHSLLEYSPAMVWEVKGLLEDFSLAKVRASGFTGAVLVFDSQGPAHVRIPDGGGLYQADDSGGGHYTTFLDWLDCFHNVRPTVAADLWDEAGNEVQWRGQRGAR
jgi:hypothetical protein